MSYAILHILKASGSSAAIARHIERSVQPDNTRVELRYLNRDDFIEYPNGIDCLDEAIRHQSPEDERVQCKEALPHQVQRRIAVERKRHHDPREYCQVPRYLCRGNGTLRAVTWHPRFRSPPRSPLRILPPMSSWKRRESLTPSGTRDLTPRA